MLEEKQGEMIDDYLKDMAIDEVVERTVRALRRYDNRTVKEERDLRLRNTKMLLENYRLLKHHCDSNLVANEMPKAMLGESLEIESLMKYRFKTKNMLNKVDEALQKYMKLCIGKESDERKPKIIKKMYMDEPSMNTDQLAQFFCVDHSVITRSKNKAIEELSVLLFGVVALEDVEMLKF